MFYGIIYIIEKLLERKCLKWALITHLNIWNTSYGQKKGWDQTGRLTLDHKKSRIDSIYLAVEGMWHNVEKISTRATTFLKTASPSEVCSQSYGAPKSWLQSRGSPNLGDFESPTWESRDKKPFGCKLHGESHSIL
jgi:hypothetical protein